MRADVLTSHPQSLTVLFCDSIENCCWVPRCWCLVHSCIHWCICYLIKGCPDSHSHRMPNCAVAQIVKYETRPGSAAPFISSTFWRTDMLDLIKPWALAFGQCMARLQLSFRLQLMAKPATQHLQPQVTKLASLADLHCLRGPMEIIARTPHLAQAVSSNLSYQLCDMHRPKSTSLRQNVQLMKDAGEPSQRFSFPVILPGTVWHAVAVAVRAELLPTANTSVK